jgi:hypothetical protein
MLLSYNNNNEIPTKEGKSLYHINKVKFTTELQEGEKKREEKTKNTL